MRMTFVKLALATGVGMATLAACGSANDGYDPSVATTDAVHRRLGPVGAMAGLAGR